MTDDIAEAAADAKDPSLRSRSLVFKTLYLTADSTDLHMADKARRYRLGLTVCVYSNKKKNQDVDANAT